MDVHERAERQKLVRMELWLPVFGSIAAVAVGWGVWYFKLVGGKKSTGPGSAGVDEFFFKLAIVGSVLVVAFGVFYGLRQSRVARTGKRVIGYFASHGALVGTMMKVECKYEFGGRTYTHAATETPSLCERIALGDPLVVYVDPKKPSRSVVIWSPMDGQ